METFRRNKDFYLALRDSKRDMGDYLFLHAKICENTYIFPKNLELLKICLKKFCFKLKQKWVKSHYKEDKFLKSNNEWLEKDFSYPSTLLEDVASTSTVAKPRSVVTIHKGKKLFSQCSTREKIRRAQSLNNNFSLDELLYATKMSFTRHNMHPKARLLQYLKSNEYNKSIEHIFKHGYMPKQKIFSTEKALCIFLMAELSKFQYITIRNETLKCGNNQWPSYFKLLAEKNNCYPPKNNIQVTEIYAKVDIQALLDHTISRIMKGLNKSIENAELILICKWGCDGASGQPRYKQMRYTDCDVDDDAVFVSSLVPLRLQNKLTLEVVWENSTPSSPWFCRPIKFQFVKESKTIIEEEISRINNEIENLKPINMNNNQIEYVMQLTMIDNKICNTITSTSSAMRCYICNATPTQMNNLELINSKVCDNSNYSFGISSLHAWIRCLECMLHIAYNLPFKKWIANTAEMKEMKNKRKEEIQRKFKEKMGLYIDHVKQGWGSSNDGNTARRFFANAELASEITGIDVLLIKKFHIILQVISSTYRINVEKFRLYTEDTAKYFVTHYGWYYMPSSVHKLLMHGAEIIKYALLPIGQLSEEAQETRHKDFKKFRNRNTRKMSRTATNEDLFYRLLLTSDPYIAAMRIKSCNRKLKKLHPEAEELIIK